MPTRTFTRDELDTIGVPLECDTEPTEGLATELHRRQIDSRRWASVHQLVFRAPDDGKAYSVIYERGLTEHQECDLFGEATEIEATEMEQREVTVTEWRPVPAKQPQNP